MMLKHTVDKSEEYDSLEGLRALNRSLANIYTEASKLAVNEALVNWFFKNATVHQNFVEGLWSSVLLAENTSLKIVKDYDYSQEASLREEVLTEVENDEQLIELALSLEKKSLADYRRMIDNENTSLRTKKFLILQRAHIECEMSELGALDDIKYYENE